MLLPTILLGKREREYQAELSAQSGLPMAESIILATARARGAVHWTQDADFERMEGVEYRAARPGAAGGTAAVPSPRSNPFQEPGRFSPDDFPGLTIVARTTYGTPSLSPVTPWRTPSRTIGSGIDHASSKGSWSVPR